MKKITLWLFLLLITNSVSAQFGCGTGVVISDGYTATGITTPGTGGAEDWNTNPTGTSINSSYWDDDVYLFQYTAGSNSEEISMTIFSVNSWNGIGIFTDCTGTTFSGELDAASSTGSNSTKTVNAVLSPNQTVYIAVGQWGTPNGLNFNVTNFSAIAIVNPPNCVSVSSPLDGAVNVSSSQITWPAASGAPNGYKLNVGTSSGGTNVLNLFDVGNVLTYNLGALLPGLTYYVTVIPYNSNGDATGCTETTFTTCGTNNAPWSYDVESAGLTTNAVIADCWSTIPTNTTSAFRWNIDGSGGTPSSPSTGPTGANSPVKYFYVEASSGSTSAVAELYSPQIDISALSDASLQFYYHMFGSNMGDLHIDIFDGTSWVNDVDVISGQQQTAQADPWVQRVVSLSAFTGTIQARFRAIRGNGGNGDIAIDDISFDEAPACLAPTNLIVYNITDTTVDIDWTGSGVVFDWEYVVQAAGTGTPTGSGIGVDYQPIEGEITGLTPNTPYEVYVRTYCSASSQSAWFGPVSFTTLCSSVTDFVEDFEATTASNFSACWAKVGSSGSAYPQTSTGIAGNRNLYMYSSSSTSRAVVKMIPVSNADAGTHRMSMKVRANFTAGETLELGYLTNPSDANTFVSISSIVTNSTTVAQNFVTTPTGMPSGSVVFALRTGTMSYSLLVDDIKWEPIPSNPPACATNVVANPDANCGNFASTLSWDTVSDADGYKITMGTTPGGNDILDNLNIGSVLSYSFTGTMNTMYYFTITPFNGAGDATGCTEVSFTTNANGCYCISNPSSNDGAGITNVQLGSTNFPNGDVTYFDHTATTVTLAQGANINAQITFATGYTYNTYILIDFNNDLDFDDAGEIVFTGESLNTNPTTYNASFMMSATAPLGIHRMRIVTADTMTTVDPCYDGSYGVTLDFNIDVVAPSSCVPPAFSTASVSHDCGNSQFSVDVNITDLGNGSPTITDGTSTWPISALGVVTVGPFAYGANVSLTLNHGTDNLCNLSIGSYNYVSCPPANDNLCNATPLTLGAAATGSDYTLIGATNENNEPIGSCFSGGLAGTVWFSFVAPVSGSVEVTTDFAGGTLGDGDTEIAVYNGTGVVCSDLSTLPAQTACDQDGGTTVNYSSYLSLTGLNSGETYYIQVDSYDGVALGTFGIQVNDTSLSTSVFDLNNFKAYPNPVKDILNLEYSSDMTSVSIFNMIGQEVINQKVNATSANINMTELNSGAYIVNVVIDGNVSVLKVIKE
ncbi:Por secretion system C-terminal sorting domain-containing protein [Flavobacterium sp. 9AF]|uniref:fibronectin type III domain-containing protein n=1 Tax=Flavobacterium sp. 9AF TaxID=2653142 RepID=UPI0012F3869C|nr:fibronectin type III domain-containing protein [Flavobacterium sp. 9AF]VXC28175.1 Por secretion system C-terminal sorting domain-containing protein [Flavobacterium sp. 9AF]